MKGRRGFTPGGTKHPVVIVGQDGILRAGCQPALVALRTSGTGRVTNPPQVANLPHNLCRPAARGFTLLEMIVASTVMAIAIVGLLSGIAGAARNASRLRDYSRIAQLARMQMDALLVDPAGAGAAGSFDPRLTGGLEAGWQSRVSTVESPPNPYPGQPELERIELEIWWMSGPQRRTFTLDAYRTHYLQAQGGPPLGAP